MTDDTNVPETTNAPGERAGPPTERSESWPAHLKQEFFASFGTQDPIIWSDDFIEYLRKASGQPHQFNRINAGQIELALAKAEAELADAEKLLQAYEKEAKLKAETPDPVHKPGDVVSMIGYPMPFMTVEGLQPMRPDVRQYSADPYVYQCSWFDGSDAKTATFSGDVLSGLNLKDDNK